MLKHLGFSDKVREYFAKQTKILQNQERNIFHFYKLHMLLSSTSTSRREVSVTRSLHDTATKAPGL